MIFTCTVLITQYALNQRSPAEGKGKGQKLSAQGIALGIYGRKTCRPVRAKALKLPAIFKAVPLQGALLTAIIPRALPWAESFCPFRACCL